MPKPKIKKAYFCQNCGVQSSKWVGKCASCGEWNSYVEEVITKEEKSFSSNGNKKKNKAYPVDKIPQGTTERLITGDKELNRVLGGGVVPGSLVLLGGEPGIGKSTLLLQLALSLGEIKVLYVSGEESLQQIKMRADRINISNPACYIITETSTDHILQHMEHEQPDLVIIDSVQTLHSSGIDSTPGSISQIRQCTGEVQRFAKETDTPVFLIGHITKEGNIAGPKILEHIVDTVLQFEGDRHYTYRILRTIKNRFGSAAELGIYEMQGDGLRQVSNPSEILISQKDEPLSGISIAATIEGMRPMLVETQALVSPAVYGTPQRTATGFDLRRMNMLLAVLEKRGGMALGNKDVFLNIAGGIKVEDPAIDLSVVCSLLSSFEDIPVNPKYAFAGEVGLSGEIRAVTRIEQRIAEADKLGFEKIYISGYNKKGVDISRYNIEVRMLNKVEHLYRELFGA